MIEIKEQLLNEELKKQIYAGFSKHAIALTGHDEIFEPKAFIAYETGLFLGVIVVELFWGALHIKYTYIDDKYRGKGLGSLLMKHALKYGQDNNCPFAFVETMSFQALEFYRKKGFELEFTRQGYKHATSLHYLRKSLKNYADSTI